MTPAEEKMNQMINANLEGLTDFGDYQDQHLENEGFKKGFRAALALPEVQELVEALKGIHNLDGTAGVIAEEALTSWKKFVGTEDGE